MVVSIVAVAAVLLSTSWGYTYGASPQPTLRSPSSTFSESTGSLQPTGAGTQCTLRDVTVPRPHEQIRQAHYTFEEQMQTRPGREPYAVVEITERSDLDVHEKVWGMFNQAIAKGLPPSSCSRRWIHVGSRMDPQANGTLSVRLSIRREQWVCGPFFKTRLGRTTPTISFAIEPYVTGDSRLGVRSSEPSIEGGLNPFWKLIDDILLGLLSTLYDAVLDRIDTPPRVDQTETPSEQSWREGRQGMRMRLKEARFVPRDGRIHAELVHSVRARRNTACEFFRNISNRSRSGGSDGIGEAGEAGANPGSLSEAQRRAIIESSIFKPILGR